MAPRKPKAPQPVVFQAIVSAPGEKDMPTPEAQIAFDQMYQGLSPDQRAGAKLVLDAITGTNPVLLSQGYRKIMRFWRAYRNVHPDAGVNL